MYPEMCEFLSVFLSAGCCALAIKIADDYLDEETDALSHNFNLIKIFGRGLILYSLIFLAFSAGFNVNIGIPLFLSSYIIGMFHDLQNFFPSRLNGMQESALVFLGSVWIFGWNLMLFALFFVFAIQLLDDILDVTMDYNTGHRNYVHQLGYIESLLLLVISMSCAYYVNAAIFPAVFLAVLMVYGMLFHLQGVRQRC